MDWKVRIAKRVIDVVGSAVGLALSAPAMPVIAAAIYLESPGPVIFKQRRAGQLLGVTKKGGGILSHKIAVPSAQAGLTSLFGMDLRLRGGQPVAVRYAKFISL